MNINLLPTPPISQRYGFTIQAVVGAVLLILTVSFTTLALVNQFQAANSSKTADQLRRSVSQSQAETSTLQKQVDAASGARQALYAVGINMNVRNLVTTILGKAPRSAAISSVNMDSSGQLLLSGKIGSMADLADFEDALRHVDRVYAVWVQSTSTDKQMTFSMQMNLSAGGESK